MNLLLPPLGAAVALLFAPVAATQGPRLLFDLNTEPASPRASNPEESVSFGGHTYFAAETFHSGRELFRTAAGAGTAELFADLAPGRASSSPRSLVVFQGRLWFSADRQLWASDGTRTGTQSLGSFAALPDLLTVVGNTLYFTGGNPGSNRELWCSDGTLAGTRQVADIFPGTGASSPAGITAFGPRLVFSATDGTSGREPWISDGTAAGTQRIRDILPGPGSSVAVHPVQDFTPLGPHLYFIAQDGVGNGELWRTDGTGAGTQVVREIGPSLAGSMSLNFPLVVSGGTLYFVADNGPNGRELWRSDGTATGTQMIVDIAPGAVPGAAPPLETVGGRVFFAGATTSAGQELWTSDGTAAGTSMLLDANPGPGDGLRRISLFGPLTDVWGPFANGVVIPATDGSSGFEPWFGTAQSMSPLADLHPGPAHSAPRPVGLDPSGTALLFAADDGVRGTELYGTDGSAAGTKLWADLNAQGTRSALPVNLRDGYDRLFFAADDGRDLPGERTPWVADMRAGRSLGLASIEAAATSTRVSLNGTWIFDGWTPGIGNEPWSSDGTPAGTALLADLYFGFLGSLPQFPTPTGAKVFFAARDAGGNRLWRTDGVDVEPLTTPGVSPQSTAADLRGLLLFLDPTSPFAGQPVGLWRSDGTVAGTGLIQTIDGGTRVVAGGGLAFIGTDVPSLWRSDGTSGGTQLIQNIPGFGRIQEIVGTRRGVFFLLQLSSLSYDLWFSDGLPAGTQRVFAPEPGVRFMLTSLTPFSDGLLFAAETRALGQELWFSDGTAAGTRVVLDLNPGPASSSPTFVAAIGARHAVFAAEAGTGGRELWITDGTAAGTRLLADVHSDGSGDPREPTLCAGEVVFSADDGFHGRELWAVDPGASAQPVGLGCGPRGVRRPELWSDDPVLGTRARVETREAEPGSAAALLLGPPRPGLQWSSDCFLFLEPAGTVLLVSAPLTTGRWDVAVPIPLDPTLDGLRVGLQVALAPPGGGIELTNGVFWTLEPG
ncbi:MAG: hypothetical protein AAF628_29875 [Planctomycetota bacterium]